MGFEPGNADQAIDQGLRENMVVHGAQCYIVTYTINELFTRAYPRVSREIVKSQDLGGVSLVIFSDGRVEVSQQVIQACHGTSMIESP